MAGDNLNVWFDPEADHLEIVLDQKPGYFEDTSLENVMRKRDADGNLVALSIFDLSSFARAKSSPGYGLWTVFNLDVQDGESFDFDVALGHEQLGDTDETVDPDSTSVDFAGPDERARCSIFFHKGMRAVGDGGKARVIERTLEIIHKPLSPPLVSVGEDRLSPVSLTSLCRDQLVLSLRLFQPHSFFLCTRNQRTVGRHRARLALLAYPNEAASPYVLRGPRVAAFGEFARRLLAFHRDRNRYRSLRWDWAGSLLATEPEGADFLRRVARLMIATDLFERASGDDVLSGEMRLLWLVMAAEALFADDDKNELSYRLANRMAVLNGGSRDEVKRHWTLVRALYEARSKLMHGTAHIPKPSKRLSELVGEGGFIQIPPGHLFAFSNLIRASILYFIALQDRPRGDVLDTLDRSLFDPSEVGGLRREANAYWGLPAHEDEMLCVGRWLS